MSDTPRFQSARPTDCVSDRILRQLLAQAEGLEHPDDETRQQLDSEPLTAATAHIETCLECEHRLAELATKTPTNLVTADEVEAIRMGSTLPTDRRFSHEASGVAPATTEIPGIIIGSCIAQGGMGAVYAALQVEPVQRKVAVKFVRADQLDPEFAERFRRERSLLARIEHPHIARMYQAGQLTDGTPYFIMEFVDGVSITEHCGKVRATLRERIGLFLRVCDAVQFLHMRQIVHRDLKPGNILVSAANGRSVPKLIDFGLAKLIHPDPDSRLDQTMAGQPIGTLRYMSPEQTGHDSDDAIVGARSDIYSLGVLLYELVTGTTPVLQETAKSARLSEVVRLICTQEPERASRRVRGATSDEQLHSMRTARERLARDVEQELDLIVGKALRKEPSQRYASADALAQDIRNFLGNRPISARPPSTLYVTGKFVRRNRFLVSSAALLVLALLGGIAGTTYGLFAARQATRTAQETALRERTARREADRLREEERAARLASEERRLKIQRAAQILQTVFEGLNPEIAKAGSDGDLRAELVTTLKQAAEALLHEEVAEDNDVLVLKVSLVRALIALGESHSAIPLMHNVVDESETSGILETRDRIALLATLGQAHREAGDGSQAMVAFGRAKAIADRELEAGDPTRLAMLNYLSILQADAGQDEAAVATIRELLDSLDPQAEATATLYHSSLGQLAFLNLKAGRLEQAVIGYEQVLRYWNDKLPEHHAAVLAARGNLAIAFDRQGKHTLAAQELRDVLRVTTAQYPPQSDQVGKAKMNLATVLVKASERDEARRLLQEVAASRMSPSTRYRARTELILLGIAQGDDRKKQSEKLADLIREIARELGPNHAALQAARTAQRKLEHQGPP